MTSRRNLLSAAFLGLVGLITQRLHRSTTDWSSGPLLCTGIELDGGGLGQTPKVHITLSSDDGTTQIIILKDRAEPFLEHQYYTLLSTSS